MFLVFLIVLMFRLCLLYLLVLFFFLSLTLALLLCPLLFPLRPLFLLVLLLLPLPCLPLLSLPLFFPLPWAVFRLVSSIFPSPLPPPPPLPLPSVAPSAPSLAPVPPRSGVSLPPPPGFPPIFLSSFLPSPSVPSSSWPLLLLLLSFRSRLRRLFLLLPVSSLPPVSSSSAPSLFLDFAAYQAQMLGFSREYQSLLGGICSLGVRIFSPISLPFILFFLLMPPVISLLALLSSFLLLAFCSSSSACLSATGVFSPFCLSSGSGSGSGSFSSARFLFYSSSPSPCFHSSSFGVGCVRLQFSLRLPLVFLRLRSFFVCTFFFFLTFASAFASFRCSFFVCPSCGVFGIGRFCCGSGGCSCSSCCCSGGLVVRCFVPLRSPIPPLPLGWFRCLRCLPPLLWPPHPLLWAPLPLRCHSFCLGSWPSGCLRSFRFWGSSSSCRVCLCSGGSV